MKSQDTIPRPPEPAQPSAAPAAVSQADHLDRSATSGVLFARLKKKQITFPRIEDNGSFSGDLGTEAIAGYPFQRPNPLRPLPWRWQRALYLTAANRRLVPGRDDAPTVAAARFLAARRAGRDRAALERNWPGLQAARALVEAGDPRQRWEVEARLLSGTDDEAIAARCDLAPAAVRWYERLFFHVRDRLAAHDWIAARALGPGLWHGFSPYDLGGIWRAFGYHGGSLVLDVIIPLTWNGVPIGAGACQSTVAKNVRATAAARRAILALMVPPNADPLRLAAFRNALLRLTNSARGSVTARKALQQANSILESLVPDWQGNARTSVTSLAARCEVRSANPARDVPSDLHKAAADSHEPLQDDRERAGGRSRDAGVTDSKPRRAGAGAPVSGRRRSTRQACELSATNHAQGPETAGIDPGTFTEDT